VGHAWRIARGSGNAARLWRIFRRTGEYVDFKRNRVLVLPHTFDAVDVAAASVRRSNMDGARLFERMRRLEAARHVISCAASSTS
jgi:hypothetical protein